MKLFEALDNAFWSLYYEDDNRCSIKYLNENIIKKFISEKDKGEYLEKTENWRIEGDDSDIDGTEVKSAYSTVDGSYIGTVQFAKSLVNKKGLSKIQVASDGHNTSSIGFSEENQKWSGWSHRAICSFGIGDMLFDEKFTGGKNEEELDKTLFIERGSVKIKELDQAKKAASNFARHVS